MEVNKSIQDVSRMQHVFYKNTLLVLKAERIDREDIYKMLKDAVKELEELDAHIRDVVQSD